MVRIETDRAATIHVNNDVEISAADMAKITNLVGKDRPFQSEVRSTFTDAASIVSQSATIDRFQIKGIVFDSREKPRSYGGDGWPNRNSFSDKEGKACFYNVPQEAHGTCTEKEAINEFNITREAFRRTTGKAITFPFPVAWGTFDEGEFDGDRFGFVILGLPKCQEVRKEIYRSAISRLIKHNDFASMARALRLRTAAMRTMHDAGIIAPYRHMDNISITAEGHVLMHDMGDPRALLREDLLSQAQFHMETYLHLMYALSPPNVLPQPKTSEELAALSEHIGPYTAAGLRGYYGDSANVVDATYDELHELLEASFKLPLQENPHPVAEYHCGLPREISAGGGF